VEPINWSSFFFLLTSFVACGFAVGVLLAQNIVRMAFYLVLSLAATAGLFFLAGADFVGAMQLMIYVGGTMVLLIFGVMLTSQDRFIEMKTWAGDWVKAFLAGGAMLFILVSAATSIPAWKGLDRAHADAVEVSKTVTPLAIALVGARPDKFDQPDAARRAGMSGYLFHFEIVSVHLLVVLVGAAYLARAKRKRNLSTAPTDSIS